MPQDLTRRTLLANSAKTIRMTVPAVMIVGSGLALGIASAQLPANIKRADLMKEDLSVLGREVVQVRVDIPAGVTAPRHNHPGEELVHVIEGALEYRLRTRRCSERGPSHIVNHLRVDVRHAPKHTEARTLGRAGNAFSLPQHDAVTAIFLGVDLHNRVSSSQ